MSLAVSLCEISKELNRQLGVTIDRRGKVRHVIVGNTEQLFIPDLGRARGGRDRFRGVRLIHTHLKGESLTEDDLTDLLRLRLDLISAITLNDIGRPDEVHYTYLLPASADQPYASETSTPIQNLDLDFETFIVELEEEFTRSTVGAIETEGQIRAIAVHVNIGHDLEPGTSLAELSELARTADVLIVDAIVQKRKAYDNKYVMGRGKLDELLLLTMQLDCELVIFDQDLSPNQVRAISEVTDVKVIDRSLLILDIFARRAHTREGKLAVELAQHKYLLPRLAHKNSAFSRLAGGIGGRGPGETKLEIDRRRARERITWLEKNLDKAQVQRKNQRAKRHHRGVPHVALVGYTNAGKSTLFNSITHSDVFAEDKLFATLHVTTRRLRFPHSQEVVFTDTVGFIRDLPKDLEVAFKATLEEVYEADLMLHIVDASDPQMKQQILSVEHILTEMDLIDKPRTLILNKIDLLKPKIAENISSLYHAIGVSAIDRSTTRPILSIIQEKLGLVLADWAKAYQIAEESEEIELYDYVEESPEDEPLKATSNESIDTQAHQDQKPKSRGKWEGSDVKDWWTD
jgi:GTPase